MSDNNIGEFEVRGLKRREVKALKAAGYNLGDLRPAQVDDFMDEVFALIFSPDQIARIDEMPQADTVKLLNRIMDETNGTVREAEAKNS